jgi:hypothetical protein
VHATGLPHCPQPPHVSTPPPPHSVDPGEHAGAEAHEHEPHAHDAVHVSVPYVLHGCVWLGAHAPCPAHVPLVVHEPVGSHVCVSTPQCPHGTGLVCPGAHIPVHAPFAHVWPVHGAGAPH